MGEVCPIKIQAPCHEPVGGRLESRRLVVEHIGRRPPRPAFGQQLVGQARIGEQELPPLMDQLEPGGERGLVGIVVGALVALDEGLRRTLESLR